MRLVLLLLFPACNLVFPLRGEGVPGGDAATDSPLDGAPPDASPVSGLILDIPFDPADEDPQSFIADRQQHVVSCLDGVCPNQDMDRHGDVSAAAFGGGSCLEVGHLSDLDPPDLTISLWVKTPATTGPLALISRENSTTHSFEILVGDNHSFQPRIQEVGQNLPGDDQWHHIAISRSSTKIISYLDGVGLSTPTPIDAIEYTASAIQIGCRSGGAGPTNEFSGTPDEVQLYKRVLTDAEINILAVR